jgi:hypothetical protein
MMIKPAFLLAGILLMSALPAHAGDTSGIDDAPALTREATASGQAADAPAAAESVGQQFARDRLLSMARTLGEAERFSVSLRISYDAVQEDGQKIEFGEIRELEITRPDKVRIVESAGDGFQDLLVFDGKSITVFNDAGLVFARRMGRRVPSTCRSNLQPLEAVLFPPIFPRPSRAWAHLKESIT